MSDVFGPVRQTLFFYTMVHAGAILSYQAPVSVAVKALA